jgi:hypothetical protein
MTATVPLSEAGLRLGLTYQQVRTLILRRELKGGRDQFGRFYADSEDVTRLSADRCSVRAQ